MAGLPKKFAKLGFKKGWKAFKMSKSRTTSTKVKRTMAKRAKIRTYGKRNTMSGDVALIAGSMIYGAGREFLSQKLEPLTKNIPAGDFADELTLGTLSYFMAKGKIPVLNKVKITREIGRAGLTIEAARVGAYLGSKFIPMTTSTANAPSFR